MKKLKLKKISVTIGIPAYNEENNIALLLRSLKKQETISYQLNCVLVVSDGSWDNTVKEAKQVGWDKVKIIANKKRLGLNPTENIIIKKTKSDILILLDADILPENNKFVANLISPFLQSSNVGIVGADTVSLKGAGFIERVLSASHSFKKYLYKHINRGNNVYNCHGRARAFSRKFYSKLRFPKNCPEDSYSFLVCISSGLNFIHAKNARIVFRSPTSLDDQAKQSKRFSGGKKILKKYFDKKQIEESFNIPFLILVKALVVFTFRQPVNSLVYLAVIFYIHYLNKLPSRHKIKYDTSVSTKKLFSEKGFI